MLRQVKEIIPSTEPSQIKVCKASNPRSVHFCQGQWAKALSRAGSASDPGTVRMRLCRFWYPHFRNSPISMKIDVFRNKT